MERKRTVFVSCTRTCRRFHHQFQGSLPFTGVGLLLLRMTEYLQLAALANYARVTKHSNVAAAAA